MPLARVVAQYQNELPKFFKRYQIQPVWRADRPAQRRFREFYQCDIDAIGSTSPVVEAELLGAVSEVLDAARVRGLRDSAESSPRAHRAARLRRRAGALHGDALVALDKLDKIGADGVEKELDGARRRRRGDDGVSRGSSAACSTETHRKTPLERLRDFVDEHQDGPTARRRARRRSSAWRTARRRTVDIRIDPSLARGLSYYTGAIMEIAVPDLAGSLGGGGRYDNLVGMFLGRDVPACGFSLGLERIIVVMTRAQDVSRRRCRAAPVDVMVTVWNDESRADALALAAELRARRAPRRRLSRGRQARQAVQVRLEPQRAVRRDRRRRRTCEPQRGGDQGHQERRTDRSARDGRSAGRQSAAASRITR